MKKFAAVLATALVMALSATSVFAAGSAEIDDANQALTLETSIGSLETAETNHNVTEEERTDVVNKITNKGVIVKDSKIAILTEITVNAEKDDNGFLKNPITITFPVQLESGHNAAAVFNYYNGEWHVVDSTYANGKVVATFKHLSPVMVVSYQYSVNFDLIGDTDVSNNGATAVSPKTGVLPVAAIAAGICLAGAAVCGKKVKFD